jgi:hypothetical protein
MSLSPTIPDVIVIMIARSLTPMAGTTYESATNCHKGTDTWKQYELSLQSKQLNSSGHYNSFSSSSENLGQCATPNFSASQLSSISSLIPPGHHRRTQPKFSELLENVKRRLIRVYKPMEPHLPPLIHRELDAPFPLQAAVAEPKRLVRVVEGGDVRVEVVFLGELFPGLEGFGAGGPFYDAGA